MSKAKFAVCVSTFGLSLLLLAGCNFDSKEEEAATPEERIGAVMNSAPSIWGEPGSSIIVGTYYAFQPEASDSDGDLLEFNIENKPEWADFDPASGVLQGVPAEGDVGDSTNIVVSVTDRTSVVSLPSFAIKVRRAQLPVDDRANERRISSPPDISGNPNRSAVVGKLYSFRPEASDSDGDELSFSIVNKPSWATFNTTTGQLKGRPAAADVGQTDRIDVSVSDGNSIAALAGFRINVEAVGPSSFTLTWRAPTKNQDGSPLKDLSGYRIYYGTSPGEYSEEIAVPREVTSHVIDNLAAGRYFLVMTSVNSRDMESRYTKEFSFELGD